MEFKKFSILTKNAGSVMIEAAFVLPVLILVTMGMLQFAWVFNNKILLSNAVAAGGLQASISRGDPNPLTDITNAVTTAATGLTTANLTTYVCVPTSGANPACSSTSSATAANFNAAQGQQVTVTLSYSCTLPLSFSGSLSLLNLTGICPLTASITELVQ